jgi:hypothetical protein
MTRLISALGLVSNLAVGAAFAQPYAPNDAGVTMGHWHLNSLDVEANKKIFVGMGGTYIKAGVFDVVRRWIGPIRRPTMAARASRARPTSGAGATSG